MNNALAVVPANAATRTPDLSPGVPLARASARVAGFLETGLRGAANTARAYASDLRGYAAFCERHGRLALPADVATLAEYIAYLASEKPAPDPVAGGSGEKSKRASSP